MKYPPKPPPHLSPATREWWEHCHANWRMEAHHSRLLEMACDAWDRYHEARDILTQQGIVVVRGQQAVRAHPAIAIERDNRIIFAKLIAQLNLDSEPNEISPAVRSARRSNRPGGWRGSNGYKTQQHSTTD